MIRVGLHEQWYHGQITRSDGAGRENYGLREANSRAGAAGNDRGHNKTTAVEGDSKTKNCWDCVVEAPQSEDKGKVENVFCP